MNKKRFEELAEDYDLDALAFPDQGKMQSMVGEIVGNYYINSGERTLRILEIGCGTGITSKEIISATNNIELLLLDESPEMIAQAKKNLAKITPWVKSKQFIEDEIGHYLSSRMYFLNKGGKFDVVASALTLHNIEKIERLNILKHINFALKKGGIFINADIIYSKNPLERKDEFKYIVDCAKKYSELGRPDLRTKWLRHINEDFSPKRIMIMNEFHEALESAGFKDISYVDLCQLAPYKIFIAYKS